MPDFSYWPFDVTSDTSNTSSDAMDIFDALGLTSWQDIALDNADSVATEQRPARYLTPEEALKDIYDRGISAFAKIRYLPVEGLYTIDVGDSP